MNLLHVRSVELSNTLSSSGDGAIDLTSSTLLIQTPLILGRLRGGHAGHLSRDGLHGSPLLGWHVP